MSGWGQALWMWENTLPEGFAPLWLLLWNSVGVAGATLPIHWLNRRWPPSAWLAIAAWAAVPMVNGMRYIQAGDEKLNNALPLLLLSLLGVGLSGVMMTVSRYAYRRWPASTPNTRFLRQGFWSALFSVVCGWPLVLIELFFVVRESPRVQNLRHRM
jgi:hypothetical protein